MFGKIILVKELEFYFDFASTYSYLSVMRVSSLVKEKNVRIVFKPILLGPIFKTMGWDTSPFHIYPAKGKYMWKDLNRRADKWGIPLVIPSVFPANGLFAARIAVLSSGEVWNSDFIKQVFCAQFQENKDISSEDTLRSILQRLNVLGIDSILANSKSDANKEALRNETEKARVLGIFGAPSFIYKEELFWGDDRLEDALDWVETHD
ncbi:2-hydroxychromene-2-carboxylate isomerase [Leptospira idonii]|uniref:2-hydroxychromene-2-carboxylate isomerase n=1 Tax=Leptospira idonii TaxID=1193500 RepID=A0A4R9LXM9_9LEPT|nr:2-hydroxychromene-2-carboxylate isomerase [Leptospira idonii]